jgi:predicted anti-sigma-YlaC factor YlaD
MMRWIAKLAGLFMATCRETSERSTDLAEGALSGVEKRRVERHLRVCWACRAHRAQTEVGVKVLGELPKPELDRAEKEALLQHFRSRQGR